MEEKKYFENLPKLDKKFLRKVKKRGYIFYKAESKKAKEKSQE